MRNIDKKIQKKIRMKIRKFCRNFPRLRKLIPAKILNGPLRESLYSRKLILALGNRESLSPRNLVPAKVYTDKVVSSADANSTSVHWHRLSTSALLFPHFVSSSFIQVKSKVVSIPAMSSDEQTSLCGAHFF